MAAAYLVVNDVSGGGGCYITVCYWYCVFVCNTVKSV